MKISAEMGLIVVFIDASTRAERCAWETQLDTAPIGVLRSCQGRETLIRDHLGDVVFTWSSVRVNTENSRQ